MQRGNFNLKLYGPSGDLENWKIRIEPIRGKRWGLTDFEKRIVYFNERIDNRLLLDRTSIHEAVHVTTSQVYSEETAINLENNYIKLRQQLYKYLEEKHHA